jgi:hypothetical protein
LVGFCPPPPPPAAAERGDRRAAFLAVHAYVSTAARSYQPGLAATDLMRVEPDLYRGCVPGRDPGRWLCLFVRTERRPAGVTPDPDRSPNAEYRRHGGFS